MTSRYERKQMEKAGKVRKITNFPTEEASAYIHSLRCLAFKIEDLWEYIDPTTGARIKMERGDYLVLPNGPAPMHGTKAEVFEPSWEREFTQFEIVEKLLNENPLILFNALRKYRWENPGTWALRLADANMIDPFPNDALPPEVE